MTHPSEAMELYGETAESFREVQDEIEDARGHEVARARVVEDLILLYRQHGLPYDDPRER